MIRFKELVFAVAMALAGLVLAVLAALAPWYPGHSAPATPVVRMEVPAGVADRP
jgi:hypothetical protein